MNINGTKLWLPLVVVLLCFATVPQGSAPVCGATVRSTEHIVINITFHGADDMRPWAQKALVVADEWYPRICRMLPSPGFTPPRKVQLVIDEKMKGIAYTVDTTVHLGADYFRHNPNDLGVIVHELTHVVQQYHHPEPGWLVEGMADYVRFYFYEPMARRPHIPPAGHHYTDGYQMAAEFLQFVATHYNSNLVRLLNVKLRDGTYHDTLFRQLTGHSLQELWRIFTRKWR